MGHVRDLPTLILLLAAAHGHAQLGKWPLRTATGEVRLVELSDGTPVIGPLFPSFGLGGSEDVNLMTDAQGNVLFITAVDQNGRITVRRGDGTMLGNGTGLKGNSSSQASAIAPRPCHPGQYYFIHHDTDEHRHYYSVIDMGASGGQGAVTEKNLPLGDSFGEGLAVSHQLLGGCRWLLSYRVEGGVYRVMRSRITAHGIGGWEAIATCVSSGVPRWWGALKLSPANDRVALSLPGSFPASAADVAIWHFDLERGEMSALQQLPLSSSTIAGVEFSPAGRFLYFVGNSDNLIADLGRISLSTQVVEVIDPAIGWWLVSIESAANGRIYVGARWPAYSSLAEVRHPDEESLAAIGFDRSALTFPDLGLTPTLPNSIEGEPPGSAPPPQYAEFDVVEQPDCQGHRFVPKSCLATSWHWEFGDGWTDERESPVHHYRVGTFSVRLRVDACGQTHQLLKPGLVQVDGIQPVASFTHPDTVCQRAPAAFASTSVLTTAQTWLFGDGAMSPDTAPTHAFAQHGPRTVTLVARNDCIMDTARAVVQVLPAGLPSFRTTSDPCDERTYFVNTTEGGERYLWEFGDGDSTSSWYHPVHIFQSEGAFEVRLTSQPGERCESTFTRALHAGYGIFPVAWHVPNAFSPNGDGVNDVLRIKGPGPCQSPVMSIHNKWGQLVWEGDAESGWDGTYGGAPAPEGVYAYIMRPRLGDAKHGWVTLVR